MTGLTSGSQKRPDATGGRRFPTWPQTPVGSWALLLTGLAIISWFALPMITMIFRDRYPVTDTWVMPAILVVLTDAAAVLGVVAVWKARERSLFNIVALVLTIPAGLFATMMVVGEGLAGV